MRVSTGLESERIRSVPNHAATAEAAAAMAAVFQSIMPGERALLAVAAMAVMMMTASDVATACL